MELLDEHLDQTPFISIITAVYNGGLTLQRTIDSVLSQSFTNFEYIIVDGGSTDDTLDIIKKNANTSLRWISEPDNGIYDAFNKGIKMAKGKLVGIINSDDWYEPGTFLSIKKAFESDTNSHIYYGMARFWDSDRLISVQGYTDAYLKHGMVSHPTCFVKKEAYDKVSKFDTTYKIAADYNLMLTLKEAGCTFHFLEIVLANFSTGGISTSNIFTVRKETLKIKFNHKSISNFQYRLGCLQLWIRKQLGQL
jgi:glycosyltransferase involved in cell wall biosynthesis